MRLSPSSFDRPAAVGVVGEPGDEARRAAPDLEALYRAHAAEVSRWAERLAGPQLEVEDIVHEVFLVAQKRLPSFRGDAKVSTWLYGITVRVVSERRRSRRWRRLFGWRGGRDLAQDPGVDVADGGPSALERIEALEARRAVYEILDCLKEDHRTVLILHELEGLSGKEIAAITGLSLANVWVRLHRARKAFLVRFQKWEAATTRTTSDPAEARER